MKCEDCKHWTYERMKSYKRYGKCSNPSIDADSFYTYFDFHCAEYEKNAMKSMGDAFQKMSESLGVGV